jgi:uncharacterized membrane protein SpoIIM required for sporulation
MEPAPESQETLMDSAVREFARRGLLLCVALFLIEVALFFVVSSAPFFPGEQALYTNQSNQIGSEFQNAGLFTEFWGIFINNFRIALIEIIPGIGLLFFAFSLYATARILEVISLSDHTSPIIVVLVLLLLFPHSWIELPAYAVATAEGVYLLYAIIKWLGETGKEHRTIKWSAEATQLGINLVIITVMLLVAALFESVEIQIGLLFWVTWIPFAVLIALVLALNKRLTKIRKEMKAEAAPSPIQ